MKKLHAASMNRMEMRMFAMCMLCCANFFDVLSVIERRSGFRRFPFGLGKLHRKLPLFF